MVSRPADLLESASLSLDDWYELVNSIYLDRNFDRDANSIFVHLVEVIGGLSLLASNKSKPEVTPGGHIARAIAWWLALCGRIGVPSVQEMLWMKFPRVCPYCRQEETETHNDDICRHNKENEHRVMWPELELIGVRKAGTRPRTLKDWQLMFQKLYPASQTENPTITFARLAEELGELAEALRVFRVEPGYFLSEAADVFAWLMHLQNLIESMNGVRSEERGDALEQLLRERYPGYCVDCGVRICRCPPVLQSTMGRIAAEVPHKRASYLDGGLLTSDMAMKLFDPGLRTLKINDVVVEVDSTMVKQIRAAMDELLRVTDDQSRLLVQHSDDIRDAVRAVQDLAVSQRVTEASLRDLAGSIAELPSEPRQVALGFLTNLAAAPWAQLVISMVEDIVRQS